MRKAVWGMLLAAGALMPAAAMAQDGGHLREGSRGQQMWAERHTRQADTGNGFQAQAQAPVQPQVQAPVQAQTRAGFGGGDRGQWQRPSADRGQWQRPGGVDGGGRWGNRDGGRPNWQGQDRGQPQAQQQPAQPATQAFNRDGNGRRDWQARAGGNAPNWQRPDNPNRGDWQARAGNGAPNWQRRDWNGRDAQAGRGYVPNHPSAGWQRGRADWQDQYRDGRRFDDRAQWNRGWRSDNRYDWNRYRYTNRGTFHLPRYYAPYGWNSYRRFSIGVTLSSILFAEEYWIDDPYEYRLPEAYGPYRWVRYYNDAMLVNIYDGEVVDVVYDIFW